MAELLHAKLAADAPQHVAGQTVFLAPVRAHALAYRRDGTLV